MDVEPEQQPTAPSAESVALAARLEAERKALEERSRDDSKTPEDEIRSGAEQHPADTTVDRVAADRKQARIEAKQEARRLRNEARERAAASRAAQRAAAAAAKAAARVDTRTAEQEAPELTVPVTGPAAIDESDQFDETAQIPAFESESESESESDGDAKQAARQERALAKQEARRQREETKQAARDAKAARRADKDEAKRAARIVEPPREPKASFLERRRQRAAGDRDDGERDGTGRRAVAVVAVVVGALGLICSLLLALGAFMAALGTTDSNSTYDTLSAICDALVGPLSGVFSFSGTNAEMKESVVAWGLGSMAYVLVGLFAQSYLRSRVDDD